MWMYLCSFYFLYFLILIGRESKKVALLVDFGTHRWTHQERSSGQHWTQLIDWSSEPMNFAGEHLIYGAAESGQDGNTKTWMKINPSGRETTAWRQPPCQTAKAGRGTGPWARLGAHWASNEWETSAGSSWGHCSQSRQAAFSPAPLGNMSY